MNVTNSVLIVGALISFAGGISYFIDTLKGNAKPNRVTWILWTIAPAIALIAQLQEGLGLHSLLTFMVGFNPLLIVIASFISRNAKWQVSRFDIACGLLSLLAIIIWQATADGVYAVVLSIAADFAAGLPTLAKAYRHPQTENYKAFLAGVINAILTLIVLKNWSVISASFAVYILLMNTALVATILLRRRIGLIAQNN